MGEVMTDFMTFEDWIQFGVDQGGFETDDILASVLPLMRQTLERHEVNQVAPFCGTSALKVSQNEVWFHQGNAIDPSSNRGKLKPFLQVSQSQSLVVIDRAEHTKNLDELEEGRRNLRVWEKEEIPPYVVYLTGYESWEHRIGYHDALTDIFSLGMITASLAMGLDLSKIKNLEIFADQRESLHHACPRLHPVVASLVVKMTALHREDRIQDLSTIIRALENYRDQPLIEDIEDDQNLPERNRRQLINSKLRDRLFDLSKRNRLLYFKPTLRSVNLTEGSVPLLLDYRNVKESQLFTYNKFLAEALAAEKTIVLDRYLRFEDAPYLTHTLDAIRRDSNREKKEYGFSELRFVLIFFRWHDLKEEKELRINSPLLLMPVEIVKKKGVRDSWQLIPSGTVAEVNPALRYQLRVLYDLELPETIDLSQRSVEDFYDYLKEEIQKSEPAVELKKLDKPQVDLVVEKARKRLDTFLQRRHKSHRLTKSYENLSYSYKRDSYTPLGLQLFQQKVKPKELPLEYLISDKPVLRKPFISQTIQAESKVPLQSKEEIKKRELYRIREGSQDNPYVWDFDLCSLTLANFSYRKMSLVRDYNTLLSEDRENQVFDEIFSLAPKQLLEQEKEIPPLQDQNLIVPADPTQISSITSAQSGKNLIIQGPPGTGKSQTITNLIADYVANGKKVLFVCEKRAALDVVHQRLASSGLDKLTCLIHDSQSDKKPFIMNLKETYEGFLSERVDKKIDQYVSKQAKAADSELAKLRTFGEAMTNSKDTQASLRKIIDRLIFLKDAAHELSDLEEESFPSYGEWEKYGSTIANIHHTLQELGIETTFADTSFGKVNTDFFYRENPLGQLNESVASLLPGLEKLQKELEKCSFDTSTCSLKELQALSFISENAQFLAQYNLLSLIDSNSDSAKELSKFQRRIRAQKKQLTKVQLVNQYWTHKLPVREAELALAQAQNFEGSFMRFINPGFWKLNKVLQNSYDFTKHQVLPSYVQILRELNSEHEERAKLDSLLEDAAINLGTDSLDQVVDHLESFQARRSAVEVDDEDAKNFFNSLIRNDDGAKDTVHFFATHHDFISELYQQVEALLPQAYDQEVEPILTDLKHISSQLHFLLHLKPLSIAVA